MAQWAPYNSVSYPGHVTPMSPIILLPPNEASEVAMTTDLLRPHSVAFGQSFYPQMHFQWQPSQQPPQPLQPQQQPDVTQEHHHVSGLLFPGPDLVSGQACYSNDQQPTYANDQDQPQYINAREARGASMPPQIQGKDWTPKPPPRSKRPSRMGSRGSLADPFSVTVHPEELSEKLKTLEVNEAPQRPPRRRKKNHCLKSATSHTLPRDFGLHSIAEDEKVNEGAAGKPTVPMPGLDGSKDVSKAQDHLPVVPMPGGAKQEAVNSSEEKPSIPQPDGSSIVPDKGKLRSTMLRALTTLNYLALRFPVIITDFEVLVSSLPLDIL